MTRTTAHYVDGPRPDLLRPLIQAHQWHALWSERMDGPTAAVTARFLTHVVRTVPYYQRWVRRVGTGGTPSLGHFPVVKKEDMVRDPSDFHSGDYDRRDCVARTSSGTSGVPITVIRDPASVYGFHFDIYERLRARIPAFAAALTRTPDDIGVVVVNDNPDREALVSIHPRLESKLVLRVILNASDEADRDVARVLKTVRIPLLSGRPRALLRLLELSADVGGSPIRPAAVFSSGDNLHEDVRTMLEREFNAPVHNGYGTRETGIVAVACAHTPRRLHVITTRASLEIHCEDGRLLPHGSGSLVITNLENWAMPFVRYWTGDGARVEEVACPCGLTGPTIVELSGRDSVYFHLGGRRFNPSLLNPIFESLPVRQFQVILRGSDLSVRWVLKPNGGLAPTAVEASMHAGFRALLGDQPVRFERVDALAAPGQKIQRYVTSPAGALHVP